MSYKNLFWLCIANIIFIALSVIVDIFLDYDYASYGICLLAIIVNSMIAFAARYLSEHEDDEDFMEDEYEDWG